MSEVVLNGASVSAAEAASRSTVLRRLRLTDLIFHGLTRTAALLVLALLSGVIIALVIGAAPAMGTFGFSFLFDQSWNPVTEKFGALAPIYGTLVTSAIAMLIAPGAIAFLLTRTFSTMLALAVLIAVLASFFGVYLSFFIDSAPAPTIVLLLSIVFIAVFVAVTRKAARAEARTAAVGPQ